MPYTFAPAATPDVRMPFIDTKAFRTWANAHLPIAEGQTLVIHGLSVNDGTQEFGKLRHVKVMPHEHTPTIVDGRPAGVEDAPTMVQPSDDDTTLEDVLASIDDLERDAELDAARRSGVADDDDTDEAPEPVRFDVTPAEDIDAIVDWQLGGRDNPARRTQVGTPTRSPRVGVRRSHANCTHATAGQAGKKARAECRKARRAAEARIAS